MKSFLRDNGLSLVLLASFFAFWVAQACTGHVVENDNRREHGQPAVSMQEYLRSGHFLSSSAENWESEFLQMGAYVMLTVFLFQRGSSESKDPDKPGRVDRDPKASRNKREAPWPVRRGGWVLAFYSYSLSLAFILLFLVSLLMHAIGSTRQYNEEQLGHGGDTVSLGEHLASAHFWFESFQNWQSEFLAIGSMVILSIFLRQRGSPESKPVDAPHRETGA